MICRSWFESHPCQMSALHPEHVSTPMHRILRHGRSHLGSCPRAASTGLSELDDRQYVPLGEGRAARVTGLRAFSALVFQPLIVRNTVTYGALGTVLIVQSWLIGVGWVIYGGQLFGCWFHNARLRSRPSELGQGAPGTRPE